MKRVLPAAASFFALSLFVGVVSAHAARNDIAGAADLTATSGPNEGQITVKWRQSSDTVGSYAVVYGTSSNNYVYALRDLSVPGNGGYKEVTIGALVPGVTYYFQVIPIGGEYLGRSNEASAVALSASEPAKSTYIHNASGVADPMAVTGSASGTIDVSWRQDRATVDGYDILYGVESGKYIHSLRGLSAQGLGGTKTVTIGALNPDRMYYFVIVPKGPDALYQSREISATAAK